MIGSNLLLTLGGIAFSSWALTAVLRRYALQRRLMDVPNARSSHHVATPRGGGAAIVLVATVALLTLDANGLVIAGALLVAAVGFVDDHRHVPPLVRLLGHFLAASLAMIGLGGFGGATATVLCVIFIAWQINLTNFMDGIDGIAGVQVVSVCAAGALLVAAAVPGSVIVQSAWAVAAATVGFLIWNWPPARIFMGDVGSGFLGYMVGVLTIQAAQVRPDLGWAWLILSGVFIVDTGVTLFRRMVRRERVHEAHRSHAYQHLAHALGAHRPVTLGVLFLNLLVLGPLAWLVATERIPGLAGVMAAYVPLVTAAVWLRAGLASDPDTAN